MITDWFKQSHTFVQSTYVDVFICLSQHEAVKTELASHQDELDRLSVKGKLLLAELKKVPDCETEPVKKDMEALVDRWLDVSGTSTMSDYYNLCPK